MKILPEELDCTMEKKKSHNANKQYDDLDEEEQRVTTDTPYHQLNKFWIYANLSEDNEKNMKYEWKEKSRKNIKWGIYNTNRTKFWSKKKFN